MGRLQDRIAVITGSSSGIGRATAFAFAREGAKVVCSDLQEGSWRERTGPGESQSTKLEFEDGSDRKMMAFALAQDEHNGPTHQRIKDAGGQAIFVKVDVTDPSSVEALVQAAVKEYGRLDIMVNNAGFAFEARSPAPIWDTPLDAYHSLMRVNVDGVFYGTKFASKQMIRQTSLPSGDRGWILNACSIYGLVGVAGSPAYALSKGAVANLTRTAALDCAEYNIHVNAVCPGFVETHMTDSIFKDEKVSEFVNKQHPLKGAGRPEDVAKAYVFLASDDASWMTGVCMPVDGGYTAR